ncbi:hypothetical protein [Gimesia aquarii]|uniref:Uncharacterized protein n=1 Tax=Gimesia aquarii TaxID=2527964 RepID=A0A517VRB2_9PLAN|nr:hypothetical protein [Gimesia aquarii]QDT95561.1 hypothetical protein V144x_10060 [Gimesia aquarii]
MSVESLVRLDDSGKTIYFAIFNSAGQIFDFNAGVLAFVDLSTPPLTPGLAATERADAGGAGKSQYIASLDLATINNTAAIVDCTVLAFEQAGMSPAPGTDSVVSQPNGFQVQFGSEEIKNISVKAGISSDTTNGDFLEVQAWLEADGKVIALTTGVSGATCTCHIRQIDAGADGIEITAEQFGDANSQNIFVHAVSNPAIENDRQYRARFTITENGVSWTITKTFHVVP